MPGWGRRGSRDDPRARNLPDASRLKPSSREGRAIRSSLLVLGGAGVGRAASRLDRWLSRVFVARGSRRRRMAERIDRHRRERPGAGDRRRAGEALTPRALAAAAPRPSSSTAFTLGSANLQLGRERRPDPRRGRRVGRLIASAPSTSRSFERGGLGVHPDTPPVFGPPIFSATPTSVSPPSADRSFLMVAGLRSSSRNRCGKEDSPWQRLSSSVTDRAARGRPGDAGAAASRFPHQGPGASAGWRRRGASSNPRRRGPAGGAAGDLHLRGRPRRGRGGA